MIIISVQNVKENCHDKRFLRNKSFLAHNVKFLRRIRQEPNKNQILWGQGILGRDRVIFTI
jgi:hypothetical protein